jgi:hypothetical protein
MEKKKHDKSHWPIASPPASASLPRQDNSEFTRGGKPNAIDHPQNHWVYKWYINGQYLHINHPQMVVVYGIGC